MPRSEYGMWKLRQAERRLFRSAGIAGSGGKCRVLRRTALRSFFTFCFFCVKTKGSRAEGKKAKFKFICNSIENFYLVLPPAAPFLFRGKRNGGKKILDHGLKPMAIQYHHPLMRIPRKLKKLVR